VEFAEAEEAEGRWPRFSGTWLTGKQTGDSIPRELLNRLTEEHGVPLYSEDSGFPKERIGVLGIFPPRRLASDTLLVVATWVFPEEGGGWHGLEFDFRYRCSRFGCRRYRYSLWGVLN